jgi:hypothetical protein
VRENDDQRRAGSQHLNRVKTFLDWHWGPRWVQPNPVQQYSATLICKIAAVRCCFATRMAMSLLEMEG